MKGFISVTDILGFIAIGIVAIILLSSVPRIFNEFFGELALANPNVVASDLASLISVSAAAPKDITIIFKGPVKQVNYTVKLKERTITVNVTLEGEVKEVSSKARYAVDNLDEYLENYHTFKIVKKGDWSFDFEGV